MQFNWVIFNNSPSNLREIAAIKINNHFKINEVFSRTRELWLFRALLIFILLIYLAGHLSILFHGDVYSAGDHIVGFFSNYVVIESLLSDLSFPVWSPYLNHGATDIWAILVFHPLITLWGMLFHWINESLNLGLSMYGVLYLGFMICYFLGVGVACYFIGFEISKRRSVALVCLILALFGPHLYQTIRAMQYNTLFFPFVFLYFIRVFVYHKVTTRNFYGLLLSASLLLSQAFGWIGHILTLFILCLFSISIAYGPAHLRKVVQESFQIIRRSPVGFFVVALICFGLGLSKILFFMRKSEIVFNSYVKISPVRDYIELWVAHFKSIYFIFTKGPYFEDSSTSKFIEAHQTNFINNSDVFDYARSFVDFNPLTLDPFYVGVFLIGLCWIGLSLDRKNIKILFFSLFLLAVLICLCSANTPRFIKYLVALMSPSYKLGTRHINYLMMFATPIVCAVVAVLFNSFLDKFERKVRPSLAQIILAVLLLLLPALIYNYESIRVLYFSALLILFLMQMRWWSSQIKNSKYLQAAIVLVVLADLTPIFLSVQKQIFQPFTSTKLFSQYGLANYPKIFPHAFSFFFGAKPGILNDVIAHPNNNLPYLKAFTGSPGLNAYMNYSNFTDDVLSISENLPKVFRTSTVVVSSSNDFLNKLNLLRAKNFPENAILVEDLDSSIPSLKTEGLIREVLDLRTNPKAWELSARKFDLKRGRPNDSAHVKRGEQDSSQIKSITLPKDFPKYWSSNVFNSDGSLAEVKTDRGGVLSPTFFDAFDKKQFQIGFSNRREIFYVGGGKAAEEHPKSIEIIVPEASWGIKVVKFSFNEATFKLVSKQKEIFVYMDRMHRNWQAFVDGNKAEIISAYGQFKAVYLHPGDHVVQFKYKDNLLLLSLWIFLVFNPVVWVYVVLGLFKGKGEVIT